MAKYMIVHDCRTKKNYLDFSDTMIRPAFETVLMEHNEKKALIERYRDAVDLTMKKENPALA